MLFFKKPELGQAIVEYAGAILIACLIVTAAMAAGLSGIISQLFALVDSKLGPVFGF